MNIDFSTLARALAAVSLGLAGTIMAGSGLFPQAAARYKERIPDTIVGLILVSVVSYIVGSF